MDKYKYEYGVCPNCKETNTGYAWCNKCDPGKFLKEGKTSGIPEIDNLIYESQLKTRRYDENLEWIPYDRFQDIKSIGEGGFASIYSATWLDGEPVFDKTKKRSKPIKVALKNLKNESLNLTWKEKLNFLFDIALNLHTIHGRRYVHKDLHSGNILQFNTGV